MAPSPFGEKAGMRASGGRTPTGFSFQADKTHLQIFTSSNSQSPHPNPPGGEGGIKNPPPVLAGPVMTGKNGIRAARCLSRRRVCADPRFSRAAQVARSEAQGPRLRVAFLCLLSLAKQRTSESPAGRDRPAKPGKANPATNQKPSPFAPTHASSDHLSSYGL